MRARRPASPPQARSRKAARSAGPRSRAAKKRAWAGDISVMLASGQGAHPTRRIPARKPITGSGDILREGAAADRQRATVFDPAAVAGRVTRQGAVADCQRATVVDAAASTVGGVARQGAVADRQRVEV